MKHIISLFEEFKTEMLQPLGNVDQGNMTPPVPQIKAVLVGGLEHRSTDHNLEEQVGLLNAGLGKDIKEIQGFHHKDRTQVVLDFLKAHPSVQVFLFSAGCSKALSITNSGFVDKNKIYVIEPYGVSKPQPPGSTKKIYDTKTIIQEAVKAGLPASNVFVGSSTPRGFGIVNGASNSNAKGHWAALTSVGAMKKGL